MKSSMRSAVAAVAVASLLALAAPASASAAFGAIALNVETGASGVGYGYATKHGAQRRAQGECPGHCRNVLWVQGRCGAIAQSSRGRYFAGFGGRRHDAIGTAKHRARRGRGGARLAAWVCS